MKDIVLGIALWLALLAGSFGAYRFVSACEADFKHRATIANSWHSGLVVGAQFDRNAGTDLVTIAPLEETAAYTKYKVMCINERTAYVCVENGIITAIWRQP